TGSEGVTWISWFCSLPGHDFFCEVQEEFIDDEFNLTGLRGLVPYYEEALATIMDLEIEEEPFSDQEAATIEAAAAMLYGMIHQRFILTRQGMRLMLQKYEHGQFGLCPRAYCVQSLMLPCSLVDVPRTDTVRLYCPSCQDLYNPPNVRHQRIDGAYFGTTFAHLFLMTFAGVLPPLRTLPGAYTPQIFGFRVNERSMAGQRMGWLRARVNGPSDAEQ
ncbi:casein kinase II subunit beta-like protein, partial [Thamnocephalis sphaerospora]